MLGTLANREYLKEQGYWKYLEKTYGDEHEDFFNFLSQFPSLGARHSLGKQIYSIIDKLPKVEIEGHWWRGRNSNCNKKIDIFPDKITQAEGRFNHYGTKSSLYLSDTRMGCMRELKSAKSFVCLQRVLVDKSKIIDLSNKEELDHRNLDGNSLIFSILYESAHREKGIHDRIFNPGYVISRYIADCVREQKYAGIKYQNIRGPGIYVNLVLFDFEKKTEGALECYAMDNFFSEEFETQ